MSRKSFRILTHRSVLPLLVVLLVLLAGAAAHANKPVPFGDRMAEPGIQDARPVSVESLDSDGLELRVGPGLEAYDRVSGEHRWSYRREGATALQLVRAGENAVVIWDDGLITSVRPADHEVRWHRAVPGLSDWLHGDGEPGAEDRTPAQKQQLALERAQAALQSMSEPEPWVTVLTPTLAMGFRDADGDLRWTAQPASGCVYAPVRAARTGNSLLVPRTCTGTNSEGHPMPGGVTGFRLDSRHWTLNVGQKVVLKALDQRRVLISDGPLLPNRIFDTLQGSATAPCGTAPPTFAVVSPDPPCEPAASPTASAAVAP